MTGRDDLCRESRRVCQIAKCTSWQFFIAQIWSKSALTFYSRQYLTRLAYQETLKSLFGFRGCDLPEEALVWPVARFHAHSDKRKMSKHVCDEAVCSWQQAPSTGFLWNCLSAVVVVFPPIFGTHLSRGQQLDQATIIDWLQFSRIWWSKVLELMPLSRHHVDMSVSWFTFKVDNNLTTNGFLSFQSTLMSFHMVTRNDLWIVGSA